MGSFNVSDAITMRTITPGKKCKIIFLVDTQLENYTNTFASHTPLTSFILNAEYDDYGNFVFEQGQVETINYITNVIRENLVEIPEGENKYHDIPVLKDTFDFDKVFEYIHEGRLYVTRSYTNNTVQTHALKQNLKVSYAAIDANVFEHMLDNAFFEIYDSQSMTDVQYSIRQSTQRHFSTIHDVANNPSIGILDGHYAEWLVYVLRDLIRASSITKDESEDMRDLVLKTLKDWTDKDREFFKKICFSVPNEEICIRRIESSGMYVYDNFTHVRPPKSVNADKEKAISSYFFSWLSNYSNYTLTPSRYASNEQYDSLVLDRLTSLMVEYHKDDKLFDEDDE